MKQILLDIHYGGLGLTSADCIAQAVLYATMQDFAIWWDKHEELKARASENHAAPNITSSLDSMEQCGGIQQAYDFIDEENKLPGGDVSQRPQLVANPFAIVCLDVSNTFNCLQREVLFEFLRKGCKAHLQGHSQPDVSTQPECEGCDLLAGSLWGPQHPQILLGGGSNYNFQRKWSPSRRSFGQYSLCACPSPDNNEGGRCPTSRPHLGLC